MRPRSLCGVHGCTAAARPSAGHRELLGRAREAGLAPMADAVAGVARGWCPAHCPHAVRSRSSMHRRRSAHPGGACRGTASGRKQGGRRGGAVLPGSRAMRRMREQRRRPGRAWARAEGVAPSTMRSSYVLSPGCSAKRMIVRSHCASTPSESMSKKYVKLPSTRARAVSGTLRVCLHAGTLCTLSRRQRLALSGPAAHLPQTTTNAPWSGASTPGAAEASRPARRGLQCKCTEQAPAGQRACRQGHGSALKGARLM